MDLPLPPENDMQLVCGFQPNVAEVFIQRGQEIVLRLREQGLLTDQTRLLDIGCGCGRIARWLVKEPLATYVGFDRHPGMIDWCKTHLTARDPRLTFDFVDVVSHSYGTIDGHTGHQAASGLRFPYADAAFDAALAASVFTHMPLAETAHYLHELRRVLRPGGIALVTVFFADNEETRDNALNFFYVPELFFAAVTAAGFTWQAQPQREGSLQQWFALSTSR